MEIQKAFTYQFDDPRWVTKLVIGGLISLVPILNLAVVGYTVEIIRNVAKHAAAPLPEWDEFEKKFFDGLIVGLAGLVYAAPALIAVAVLFSVVAISGATSSQGNQPAPAGGAAAAAGVVLVAAAITFLVVYSLVLSIIRPIILVIFSREGTFASCFRIGEITRMIGQRSGPFFTIWLVVIVAGLAIGLIVGFINLVTGWIPCLGWIAGFLVAIGSAIYLLTADAYLFGQFRLTAEGVGALPPS